MEDCLLKKLNPLKTLPREFSRNPPEKIISTKAVLEQVALRKKNKLFATELFLCKLEISLNKK